ncbi:hypothetical protein AAMO2058_001509900 [Amorphochlora amoebiformis]
MSQFVTKSDIREKSQSDKRMAVKLDLRSLDLKALRVCSEDIVCVGIVGDSPINIGHGALTNDAIGRQKFNPKLNPLQGIEAYYDSDLLVLYLRLFRPPSSQSVTSPSEDSKSASGEISFFQHFSWLSRVCHYIVITQSCPRLNVEWLRILRGITLNRRPKDAIPVLYFLFPRPLDLSPHQETTLLSSLHAQIKTLLIHIQVIKSNSRKRGEEKWSYEIRESCAMFTEEGCLAEELISEMESEAKIPTPTQSWIESAKSIALRLLSSPPSTAVNPMLNLSLGVCHRALQTARETYTYKLPPRFTRQEHENRLKSALEIFRRFASGSAKHLFEAKLKSYCLNTWHDRRHITSSGPNSENGDKKSRTSGYMSRTSLCGRIFVKLKNLTTIEEVAQASLKASREAQSQIPTQYHTILLNQDSHLIPSWGLTRLGDFAYYDPSEGLQQPGFHPRFNRLHPWRPKIPPALALYTSDEKIIKAFHESSGCRTISNSSEEERKFEKIPKNFGKKSKNKKPSPITCYVGVEYECRKHRCILPLTPSTEGKSHVKGMILDIGYPTSNLPVTLQCPVCLSSKPLPARFSRLFLAIPKSKSKRISLDALVERPKGGGGGGGNAEGGRGILLGDGIYAVGAPFLFTANGKLAIAAVRKSEKELYIPRFSIRLAGVDPPP